MPDPARIVVADDSPTIRAVLSSALRQVGYDVHEAHDGEQALARIRELRPQLALLDIEMPGMDGREVLRRAKEDPETAGVPIIFLTARVEAADVVSSLEEGAYDYLRKPVEQSELIARVHAALRTKGLEDELLRRNEELDRLASTDHLTGVYNRRVMGAELTRLVARAKRHERPFSVVVLDVDHFKAVNDTHGHEAGDAVLVTLTRRVAARLRADDLVGRWGGEEFLVLAPETDLDGAVALAEDLREAVGAGPVEAAGTAIPVTVSAGVAMWADETEAEIVGRADAALYEAKAQGRNRVCAAATPGSAAEMPAPAMITRRPRIRAFLQ